MTNKYNLRTFLNKYNIRVLDTNKREHRRTYPIPMHFQDDLKDLGIETDTETLYTVEITESALTFLADIDSNFFKYSGDGQRYARDLVVSHQEESEALKNNPELRALREQYDIYLRLAAQNPGNLKSFINQ